MFGKPITLFKLFGFAIRLDLSWFVIAILVTWSLAVGLFPALVAGLSPATYWTMAVAGALGLFISIILHELGHSLVARRYGLAIKGITLFIFGGVAELEEEPQSARAEFMVAIAGPIVSILIAVACFGLTLLGQGIGWPISVVSVLSYLATINTALVVFNAIPAFPLDGGRVLRSILWHWKGDLRRATRITSQLGSGFGMVFMGLGIASIIFGNFIGGLWWFLIGMFLRNAASMSYRQLIVRETLQGEPVRRFMVPDPVTVSPELSVRDLIEQYVYRYYYKLFPVVDNERLVGCITVDQVKELAHDRWDTTTVGAILDRCSAHNTIHPDADALDALTKMHQTGSSRLLVLDGDRLVGIIALKDLLRFFSVKLELEDELPGRQAPRSPAEQRSGTVQQQAPVE